MYMNRKKPKVLVVATSRKTKGGITSVLKAHETGTQWKEFHCKWIETHRDKNKLIKLLYFFRAFFIYMYFLPSCDLVHIHTSQPASAIRKIPFMALAKLLKKKTIVHLHATISEKEQPIYRYLFGQADCILVLADVFRTSLNHTYHLGEKIQVLYNPCDEPADRKKYRKQKNILYAGTISPLKGYIDLLNAFGQIANQYPEWTIVFAGVGEIERAKMLAETLGIVRQIVFLGWISGEEKNKAFQKASIFCLPSYTEGFPMAVLDAWAYKLPVITTPVGGLIDILKDEENALVFEPGDVDKLAIQLERMIADNVLRTRIEKASQHLAEITFNRDEINTQLRRIYSKMIQE